jgi:dodecin
VFTASEVIGTSTEFWEAAARSALETAAASMRELRVAEIVRQHVTIENGSVTSYRVRLGISFKYDSES